MKRIGPGGTRMDQSRILRLTVRAERLPEFDFFTCEPPKTIPMPRWRIEFEFAQLVGGYEVRDFTIVMEARQHYDEDRWRDELLQSRYLDSMGMSSEVDRWDKSTEPITTVIIDCRLTQQQPRRGSCHLKLFPRRVARSSIVLCLRWHFPFPGLPSAQYPLPLR